MNIWSQLIGATEVSGADTSSLDTGTAVLILLTVAVAWLASSVMRLRNEVEELKDRLRAKVRPATTAAAPVAPTSSGPTPAELAAIAAAVHCVLGSGVRLVAVGNSDTSGQQAWSREGRRQVFQSHQLR